MKIKLRKVFMENTTYFGPNKLFLENKDHENLRACVCIHAYAHPCSSSACACFMPAYVYTCMRVHAKVPEIM